MKSKDKRTKRVMKIRNAILKDEPFNKSICDECGFHIRSENHLDGQHHKNNIIPED
jgi:hypothetical protein